MQDEKAPVPDRAGLDPATMDNVADSAARKLAEGDAQGAWTLTRGILQSGRATVRILDVDASAALQLGHLDAALACLEKAMAEAGTTVNRALLYGDVLLRKRRWQAAASTFEQVIKHQEDNLMAWLGLGHCFYATDDAVRAVDCYRRVLNLDPEHRDATLRLGRTLLYMGHALRACQLLEPLHEKLPESTETAYYYGEALRQSQRIEDASEVFQAYKDSPEWGLRIAKGLISTWLAMGKLDSALELTQAWLVYYPGDADLLGFKAKLLHAEGEADQARAIFHQIMEEQPDNYAIWEAYSKLMEEPMSADMLAQLHRHRDIARKYNRKRHLAGIHFAACRHYELTGETGREMEELNQANAIMAELDPFDSEAHADKVTRIVRMYTAHEIAALSAPADDFRPVFILCPPRSGGTLLEQALARHPGFWPGGEGDFAPVAWHELTQKYFLTIDVESHAELDAGFVQQFAEQYRALVREAGCGDDVRMVHKGVNNYKHAGLLKMAFPRARFIELRRNPMDLAFGCYRQNFSSQPFSATFDGCASEVALYQKTMAWWHEQIGESIYRLDYETLVDDFENSLADLLAWLGEPWEPACVDFRRKSRVTTASVNQVRQGVFKQGVGRWLRYRDYLGPLEQAMEYHGVRLDD